MVSGKSWEGNRDRARVWDRASYRERGLYCTARSVTGSLGLVPGHPVQLALCPRALPLCLMMIHTHTHTPLSTIGHKACESLPFALVFRYPRSVHCPWASKRPWGICLCVCLQIRAVSEGNHYFPGPFLAWGLPWRVDAQGTEGGRTTWKGSLDTFPSFVISSPTLDLEQVNGDRSHSHWGTLSPYNSFRGWTLETLWQPCPRGNTCTKLEKNQSNNQGIF